MWRLFRLAVIGLAVLVIGGAPSTISIEATPGVATPSPRSSYAYGSDEPTIMISSGPMIATLRVDRLPTDRYGVVTVATDSDAPFRFTVTPPEGKTRTIFETDAPDALTGALLLDQTGEYTLSVEATGSWALIIR